MMRYGGRPGSAEATIAETPPLFAGDESSMRFIR